MAIHGLLACCLFLFLSILYFSNSLLASFVTSAGVFLELAIHAFIRSQGFSNRVLICVYYFGWLVFRMSHTSIQIRSQLFYPRSYMLIISARLFLERAIHAFISSQLFQPRSYMRIISACVFLEHTHPHTHTLYFLESNYRGHCSPQLA